MDDGDGVHVHVQLLPVFGRYVFYIYLHVISPVVLKLNKMSVLHVCLCASVLQADSSTCTG